MCTFFALPAHDNALRRASRNKGPKADRWIEQVCISERGLDFTSRGGIPRHMNSIVESELDDCGIDVWEGSNTDVLGMRPLFSSVRPT
jgi:hypothetical protein